jgi:hypothetical protein
LLSEKTPSEKPSLRALFSEAISSKPTDRFGKKTPRDDEWFLLEKTLSEKTVIASAFQRSNLLEANRSLRPKAPRDDA